MKYLEQFIEAYLKLYEKIKKPLLVAVILFILVMCIMCVVTIFYLTGVI